MTDETATAMMMRLMEEAYKTEGAGMHRAATIDAKIYGSGWLRVNRFGRVEYVSPLDAYAELKELAKQFEPIRTPLGKTSLLRRTVKALVEGGFETLEEVTALIEEYEDQGRDPRHVFLRLPNFGRKSLNDLMDFLGKARAPMKVDGPLNRVEEIREIAAKMREEDDTQLSQ